MVILNIFNFFKQSFPFFKRRWVIVVISTVWVFLVFLLLMPFGIQRVPYRNWIVLYFTIAMFISSSIVTYLFPLIFKKFFNPKTWTNGKFFFFSLMIILFMAVFSIICYYFVRSLEGGAVHSFLENNFIILIMCILVGTVPTIIVYLIEAKSAVDIYISKKDISIEENLMNEEENAVILSPNTKDELKLIPNKLLYVEVIKNNITVYYLDGENVCERSLRMTLQQFIESFTDHIYIVRCHRAFVVNTSYITKISGNSRGYSLTLKHVKKAIPASKLHIDEIKEKNLA